MYFEGQTQWQVEEASSYTHPLDVQLFSDRPLLHLLPAVEGRQILDIGCGNGYLSRKLHERGAEVTGIDVSAGMARQAQALAPGLGPTLLCVASADSLPFVSSVYDAAICSLTINNLPSADMVKRAFFEAARLLKPGGVFVVSLPHPHTLAAKMRFRWTDWEAGQTQDNLVPGESFKRKIMGHDGIMIPIVNYYWPKQVLINFATRAGFKTDGVREDVACEDEIAEYCDELDATCSEVPFFLVISFVNLKRTVHGAEEGMSAATGSQ